MRSYDNNAPSDFVRKSYTPRKIQVVFNSLCAESINIINITDMFVFFSCLFTEMSQVVGGNPSSIGEYKELFIIHGQYHGYL